MPDAEDEAEITSDNRNGSENSDTERPAETKEEGAGSGISESDDTLTDPEISQDASPGTEDRPESPGEGPQAIQNQNPPVSDTDGASAEQMQDSEDGKATPTVDIRYAFRDGTALPGDRKQNKCAYYSGDIQVRISLYNVPDSEFAGYRAAVISADGVEEYRSFVNSEMVLNLTKDGKYRISVCSTYHYGESCVFAEEDPSGAACGVQRRALPAGSAWETEWTLVRDTEAPKVSAQVRSGGTGQLLCEIGRHEQKEAETLIFGEREADVQIRTEDDLSPVRITGVLADSDGSEKKIQSGEFIKAENAVAAMHLTGAQTFRIKKMEAEDLAGNRAVFENSEKEICLDPDVPVLDMPDLNAAADGMTEDGRPLFADTAEFAFTVRDAPSDFFSGNFSADSGEMMSDSQNDPPGCSGLQNVSWSLQDYQTGEVKGSSELYRYQAGTRPVFSVSDALSFGADCESDTLELMLVAEDRAGNRMQKSFRFAIDGSLPEIRIELGGVRDPEDGRRYCRADNCDITVFFSAKHRIDLNRLSCAVQIDGEEIGRATKEDLSDDRKEAAVHLSAAKLAGKEGLLQDGTHTVTALVKNAAGRESSADEAFVLDTVCPVFTVQVEAPEAARQTLCAQGNRYYFNAAYRLQVCVTDDNLSKNKMFVRRGSVTRGQYDSSTVRVSTFPTVISISGEADKNELCFADTESADGVYRYMISGTDRAGNPAVCAGGSDGVPIERPEDKTSYQTPHIVVDTVAPKGIFTVSDGNRAYYRMDSDGQVSLSQPFRRETVAYPRAQTDTSAEHSPVSGRVRLVYTAGGTSEQQETELPASADYTYGWNASGKLSGRQVFHLSKWIMTDLAGNQTICGESDCIRLDTERPAIDRFAPTVHIAAVGAGGRKMFRGDIPIAVSVSDPDTGISGSGLDTVTLDVYVDGRKISSDARKYALIRQNRDIHGEPSCSFQIILDAATHNSNDIEVVVTSSDLAGNSVSSSLQLGIDITAPKIRMIHNDNTCRNGRYFNQSRMGQIVVQERNFDPSLIQIKTGTQAQIGKWVRQRGKRANGDDDIWTAPVEFVQEGEYFLEIAGGDAVGNRAESVQYEGTAARNFVIDCTAPVLRLSFDSTEPKNSRFYRHARTAVLQVEDNYFGGEATVHMLCGNRERSGAVQFRANRAEIVFDEEGSCALSARVMDLAGNVSNPVTASEFVIDRTPPEIRISGVKDSESGRTPFYIRTQVRDRFPDLHQIQMKLYRVSERKGGKAAMVWQASGNQSGTDDAGGRTYSPDSETVCMEAMPVVRDGHYRLILTGTDLAGNCVSRTICFTENHSGTSFQFCQKELDGGCTSERFAPAFILTDLDAVTVLSVRLNGRETGWEKKDNRVVLETLPDRDGLYVIDMDTVNRAGCRSSMKPVEVRLDRKAPVILIEGLQRGRKYYTQPVEVTAVRDMPQDRWTLVRADGKEVSPGVYGSDTEHTVHLYFDTGGKHSVTVRAEDAAGNRAEKTVSFVIINNPAARWIGNRPVFYLTLIGGTAALLGLLFLIAGKRKKQPLQK